MAFRNFGLNVRGFTTTELATLVTLYGTAGTVEAGAIRQGTIVRDTTTGALKVYDTSSNAFVAGTDYTP
jgi:hypothetical protein